MNAFVMLLRRELWEHRKTFVTLPMVVAGLCFVFLLFGLGTLEFGKVQIDGDVKFDIDSMNGETVERQLTFSDSSLKVIFAEGLQKFTALPEAEREKMLDVAYTAYAMPLALVLMLVVPTYLLSCLYEERKDRSILFWKSMPVSDVETVVAKLVAGLVMVPLIYLGFVVVLHLLMFCVSVIVGLLYEVPVWDALVTPANLVARWFKGLLAMLYIGVWSLPLLAWVMLVSSSARSVPIAWAIGVPVALIMFEQAALGTGYVARFIARHASPFESFEQFQGGLATMMTPLISAEYLLGLVFALAMFAMTIHMRGKASEL